MTRLFCETSRIGVVLGRQWLFQLFGYSETYNEVFIQLNFVLL